MFEADPVVKLGPSPAIKHGKATKKGGGSRHPIPDSFLTLLAAIHCNGGRGVKIFVDLQEFFTNSTIYSIHVTKIYIYSKFQNLQSTIFSNN